MFEQKDHTTRVVFMHDGDEKVYTVRKESGRPVMDCPVVCGADFPYLKNGMRHNHYLMFERDIWVFDGRYLTRLGSPMP